MGCDNQTNVFFKTELNTIEKVIFVLIGIISSVFALFVNLMNFENDYRLLGFSLLFVGMCINLLQRLINKAAMIHCMSLLFSIVGFNLFFANGQLSLQIFDELISLSFIICYFLLIFHKKQNCKKEVWHNFVFPFQISNLSIALLFLVDPSFALGRTLGIFWSLILTSFVVFIVQIIGNFSKLLNIFYLLAIFITIEAFAYYLKDYMEIVIVLGFIMSLILWNLTRSDAILFK